MVPHWSCIAVITVVVIRLLAEWNDPLGYITLEALPFSPQFTLYSSAAETVKHRSTFRFCLSSYFPVDKTVIYPEYRRNTYELR